MATLARALYYVISGFIRRRGRAVPDCPPEMLATMRETIKSGKNGRAASTVSVYDYRLLCKNLFSQTVQSEPILYVYPMRALSVFETAAD